MLSERVKFQNPGVAGSNLVGGAAGSIGSDLQSWANNLIDEQQAKDRASMVEKRKIDAEVRKNKEDKRVLGEQRQYNLKEDKRQSDLLLNEDSPQGMEFASNLKYKEALTNQANRPKVGKGPSGKMDDYTKDALKQIDKEITSLDDALTMTDPEKEKNKYAALENSLRRQKEIRRLTAMRPSERQAEIKRLTEIAAKVEKGRAAGKKAEEAENKLKMIKEAESEAKRKEHVAAVSKADEGVKRPMFNRPTSPPLPVPQQSNMYNFKRGVLGQEDISNIMQYK